MHCNANKNIVEVQLIVNQRKRNERQQQPTLVFVFIGH